MSRWGVVLLTLAICMAIWQVSAQQMEVDRRQPGDIEAGKRLFRTANWTATGLTCFHCHADFNEKKTPDGQIRPGHSLFNGGFRTLFHRWDRKNTPSVVNAVSACMTRWITERKEEGNVGKEPARHHVRQLIAYLQSGPMTHETKAKPIEPIWIDELPSDRTLMAGDSTLGARVFRRSCQHCHLPEGDGPAPSLVRNGYSRYQIAKKVRNIDNAGLGGLVMPAFQLDRLSDRELINVCAYVFQM